MKITPGGFTIVEVMIVLAISGTLLGSAVTVFTSRRESTEFSQAVYDVQSQIQSLANAVSSQNIPGASQYTCSVATVSGEPRPVLTSGSGTGQNCIYLGEAIQVTPNQPTIAAYPVFGLRTTASGDYPATVSDADPEPAISAAGVASSPNDPNNLLLINTYTMMNGLQTVSAKFSGAENDILTFYSSLQNSNTSGNEIDVSSMNYTGGSIDPRLQVKNCVENTSCSSSNSVTNASWDLCLTDKTRSALLSLKGTATGIVTTLNMNGCS